jgi:hypothetical protein
MRVLLEDFRTSDAGIDLDSVELQHAAKLANIRDKIPILTALIKGILPFSNV